MDRAVAGYFIGELSAGATLEALASSLERADLECAIVRETGEIVTSVRARASRAALKKIAQTANGMRLYATAGEEALAETTWAWAASEPIAFEESERAAVVVGGLESAPEILVLLPRLAKACGAVMLRDRADGHAWKLTHTLNNLLAGAIANAEYAASLIEAMNEGATPTAEERADIVHAIENTREGVKKMVSAVKALTTSRR